MKGGHLGFQALVDQEDKRYVLKIVSVYVVSQMVIPNILSETRIVAIIKIKNFKNLPGRSSEISPRLR